DSCWPDMNDESVIFEQTGPDGVWTAIVDASDGALYFYLWQQLGSESRVKNCWVRNLRPAPAGFDASGMKAGRQPLLPASYCGHPGGLPAPDPDSLNVLWFEECDAAALFERDNLLAVIPFWSGSDGF